MQLINASSIESHSGRQLINNNTYLSSACVEPAPVINACALGDDDGNLAAGVLTTVI